MTTLAPLKAAAAELGDKVKARQTGLVFDKELSFEEWAWVGSRLGNLTNAATWWIADWVSVGFGRYGQLANEAAEKFGLSPDTLSDYKAVAERFELPSRHGNLSFRHHREVAYLEGEERETWLARAEAEGWSAQALREALQADRQAQRSPRAEVYEQLRLTVEPDRAERWKAAAERAGSDFTHWARDVLDEAAA